MTAPNFRSLLPGGFFSTPDDNRWHAALRNNNWGAINGAKWQRTYPGYVGERHTSYSYVNGNKVSNKTTVVEAPEYGVAMWWELMRRYNASGVRTVRQIIKTYGGGQDYSAYETFVVKRTGFSPNTTIDLYDDAQLLKFADAMFAYEAGVAEWKTARGMGLRDEQILYGFAIGRKNGQLPTQSVPPVPPVKPQPAAPSNKVIGFSPLRWLLNTIFKR